METRERDDGPSPRGRRALGVLLLFVAVTALYAPSLRFGFIHDDRQLILRQPVPSGIGDVLAVFAEPHWPGLPYYRPVTRATMVLQKYLHGDRPAPFHLFNVLLMGVAAVLVYALLRRRPFRVQPVPALLAAALFAVHPIASDTVYPICSGRETLLPTVLVLGTLLAWLTPGARGYVSGLLLATASLFAKEVGAIVPGLLAAADVLGLSPDPPGRDVWRWARRYAPLAVVFAIYFAIRSRLFGTPLHPIAVLDHPGYPLLTLAYTLQTTFAPFVDLVYEPHWPIWWSWPRAAVWVLALCALSLLVVRRRAVSRSAVLFFGAWWLAALAPTANLLVQEAPFAERYGFLALAGPIGIVALLASDLWTQARWRPALATAGAVAIAACATISFLRGPHFADEIGFATTWVRNDPDSYKAQLNLGQTLVELERWDEASTHLAAASRLRPRSGLIHNGLGYALWRKGDRAAAATQFELAIQLSPKLAVARTNYGDLLLERGEVDDAIESYQQALRLEPRDARTHRQLARALRRKGRSDLAVRHYERSLELDPRSAITHYELGELLEERGDRDLAAARYEAALRLRPDLVRARRRLDRLRAHDAGSG